MRNEKLEQQIKQWEDTIFSEEEAKRIVKKLSQDYPFLAQVLITRTVTEEGKHLRRLSLWNVIRLKCKRHDGLAEVQYWAKSTGNLLVDKEGRNTNWQEKEFETVEEAEDWVEGKLAEIEARLAQIQFAHANGKELPAEELRVFTQT